MANRLGVLLHSDDVRWAAAEHASETVIAAVLLLHQRSVEDIAPQLSATELEHVIKLVGRSPRHYAPGTLDALKSGRAASPTQTSRSLPSSAKEEAAAHPHTRPSPRPEAKQGIPERPTRLNAPPKPTGFQGPPARESNGRAKRTGTPGGTVAETARRRLIVDDLMKAGLSVRQIASATDIPRSSVHRAMVAIARAEAKKQVAITEIAAELLGQKLSHRRRRRA
jgi:hypothetical protein